MIINGKIKERVEINPIDVLEKLIDENIGINSWILEKNGKYYKKYEENIGPHVIDDLVEISKENYDFINSLENSINYLKKQK